MCRLAKPAVTVLALGLVLLTAGGVSAGIVFGPSGSGGYNAYDLITGSFTWDQARVDALTRSFPGFGSVPANPALLGHMASLTTATENSFVAGSVGSGDRWIGLTDSDQTSTLDGVTMLGTEAGNNPNGGWW